MAGIPSRGLVLAVEFCEATGLDQATLQALVVDGRLAGVIHEDGTVAGLFDDELPTFVELQTMGLEPTAGYHPDTLRSHAVEQAEGDGETGSSWTMSWPG